MSVFCDESGTIVRGPGVGSACTGSVHFDAAEVMCTNPIHAATATDWEPPRPLTEWTEADARAEAFGSGWTLPSPRNSRGPGWEL